MWIIKLNFKSKVNQKENICTINLAVWSIIDNSWIKFKNTWNL